MVCQVNIFTESRLIFSTSHCLLLLQQIEVAGHGSLSRLGKSTLISPVVEGGVSPPSEGVNETECIIPIWGHRFRISMLFSHIRGRLRGMGAFAPKNGPTLST